MKRIRFLVLALTLPSALNLQVSTLFAQGTAFTYQGQLQNLGGPANGSYDFTFALFNTNNSGAAIAGPVTNSGVLVTNGLFTTIIDFGSGVFNGAGNWLEIGVETNSGGSFTTLSPRQQITPTPYAITASAVSGEVAASQVTGTLPLAQLPPAVVTNGQANVTLMGNFSGNGAGLTNVSSPGILWQTASGTVQAQPNQGYIANGTNPVTITLPLSPNVGDIIRVSGAGSGGWTIAQNAGQSILGAGLGSLGPNLKAGASTQKWTSVAASADDSQLAATVYGGQIWTSSDSGVTWIAEATNLNWTSVASSADGTKLVAATDVVPMELTQVVAGIFTSADSGVTWTRRLSGGLSWAVASSTNGTKLVGVGSASESTRTGIWTSSDSGATWTQRFGGSMLYSNWNSVASSADGTKLVATINPGYIYTSTNSGANWTPGASGQAWTSVASSADGTKLVATVAGGGQIWTSSDSGATWTANAFAQDWNTVASSADGSKLVAGVVNGGIYVSSDSGFTWTPRSLNVVNSFQGPGGLALSADGTKLVAADYGGFIYTSADNTTPGSAGYLYGGQNASVELQYIGNNLFLPLSYAGAVNCY